MMLMQLYQYITFQSLLLWFEEFLKQPQYILVFGFILFILLILLWFQSKIVKIVRKQWSNTQEIGFWPRNNPHEMTRLVFTVLIIVLFLLFLFDKVPVRSYPFEWWQLILYYAINWIITTTIFEKYTGGKTHVGFKWEIIPSIIIGAAWLAASIVDPIYFYGLAWLGLVGLSRPVITWLIYW